MSKDVAILQANAIDLLKQLIATPSFSKEEDNSSALIRAFLEKMRWRQSNTCIISGQRINTSMQRSPQFY